MFILDGSAADAQLEAAGGHLVQGGGHLGQYGRMAKLVAQHHVSDPQPFGTAQQRSGERPCLQRVDVGGDAGGAVHVVVEPQRTDAELFAALRAVQDVGVAETHLRDVDPDFQRCGHCLMPTA